MKGRFVLSAGPNSQTKQIHYLLGLTSPDERQHIEAEYFHSEDAFQQMMSAEDDLYDAYARGELTSEERRRFEQHFLTSFRERNRVQFARALADVIPDVPPTHTTPHAGVFAAFRVLHGWHGSLQFAAIATVLALAAAVSWLAIDRKRMSNELRDLRAESAELRKQNQVPPQALSADTSKQTEGSPTNTPRPPIFRTPKANKRREQVAARYPVNPETVINTQDASLGDSFIRQGITQLPLSARNVPNLLSLQPAITPSGHIALSRADQAGITLDGVDAKPVPTSLPWIRFLIQLETPAQHTDYRVTIKTGSAQVAEVDWIEPVTPDQTIIETPAIHTADLLSGDYVLLLSAKDPDGRYVKLAEYAFKVVRR